MRNVNRNVIGQFGQEVDLSFKYKSTIYNNDDIYRGRIYFDGSFFKSVMKALELETPVEMQEGDMISEVKLTYTLNEESTVIDYGDYIIKDRELDADTGHFNYVCYDQMIKSMVSNDLEFEGPYTLATYTKAVCDRLGYTFDQTALFCNSTMIITENPYDANSTFRDFFEDLAQATGSVVSVNNSQIIINRALNETTVELTEDGLKSASVEKAYGPVNSVVLSRGDVEDSVYAQDQQSIEENGLCEIKFDSNPLLDDTNDAIRLQLAQNILNEIKGLTFNVYELESFGIGALELFDGFDLTFRSQTYHCYCLKNDVLIQSGITETLACDVPNGSQTDYSIATPEALATRAYLKVDKINNRIDALVSETEEKFTSVEQTSSDISLMVSEMNENLEKQQTSFSVEADGSYIRQGREGYYSKFIDEGMQVYSNGERIAEATASTFKAPSFTTTNWTMREEEDGKVLNFFRGEL